jgi:hypothetical protein
MMNRSVQMLFDLALVIAQCAVQMHSMAHLGHVFHPGL